VSGVDLWPKFSNLELGSASVGFSGCVRVAKSLLFSMEFWPAFWP